METKLCCAKLGVAMSTSADASITLDKSEPRMKLGFAKLVVHDLVAMQAFYMQTFELILHRVIEDQAFTEVILKWADAAEANARLVLFSYKDGRDLIVGNGHGPLGLYVPDVDVIIERAVSMGAMLVQPAYDLPMFRIAFLNDPEGHELEILAGRSPHG
jgi:lactoylglutathione lyase